MSLGILNRLVPVAVLQSCEVCCARRSHACVLNNCWPSQIVLACRTGIAAEEGLLDFCFSSKSAYADLVPRRLSRFPFYHSRSCPCTGRYWGGLNPLERVLGVSATCHVRRKRQHLHSIVPCVEEVRLSSLGPHQEDGSRAGPAVIVFMPLPPDT